MRHTHTEANRVQIFANEDDKRTDFRSVWAVRERGHGRGRRRVRLVAYLSIPRMTSAEVADRGRSCVCVCARSCCYSET